METAHQFLGKSAQMVPFGLHVCSLDSGPFLTSWPYALPNYLLFLPLWHSGCRYQGAPSQECHLGEFSSQKQTHMRDGIWFFTNSIRQDRLGFAAVTNSSQISNATWLSSVCSFNHMMVPRWPSMTLHFNRRHQAFFSGVRREDMENYSLWGFQAEVSFIGHATHVASSTFKSWEVQSFPMSGREGGREILVSGSNAHHTVSFQSKCVAQEVLKITQWE